MCRHNPGIYQVYTRLRNCRLGKDILGISQSYSCHREKGSPGWPGPLNDATLLPGRRHGRRVVAAIIASSSPSPSPSSSHRRRPGRRSRVVAAVAGPRRRVPRAGPVGAPRAVMNIKHPCKPKPVCRGIPTAILLQDGWQDFKCAGITLVYTRYIPGLEIADSEKISLVYPSHILFT